MTSRERIAVALRCEQPDRVPYCELGIDRALAQKRELVLPHYRQMAEVIDIP